ncbi:bifunctional hydroxymethylpyrimidine kinase/phosphomethylpyrimidine kinase [Marinobacterium arenosum]|uniref:bifunctional hydroxymethylpyrimidine kinase/phosphomethylpyrimidine kinase n=1 Tax=Marinobacterium arenosum TaxID=2862496 RepID=UPI001C97E3AB|nr:bifunctional hydroxymethylpyrimidine kinase/phosphomethylpyrimidine kinase [Marinobacterium arenosum]MBY4678844.1 bifunctional hydroxymethylpyrimidine kinase/phosphomethylpyrimidine kinase [Marinobacterium arenosum]
MTRTANTPIALTIAGSDSGGGAGIQADLKTFSALGAYGASVISALTAQNTREVRAIQPVPVEMIQAQLDAVFDDLDVSAIKTGMLGDAGTVAVVARSLAARPSRPLVIDPVMIAKSGDALLQQSAVEVLKSELLPQATLLTPNLPEAAVLLGCDESGSLAEMHQQVRALHALGSQAVLLKGGHLNDAEQSIDLFFDGRNCIELAAARLPTNNTHGTGCTLASAICALLARGWPLAEAVAGGKRYIGAAIAAADALTVGRGHGPVHHFHALWQQHGIDP